MHSLQHAPGFQTVKFWIWVNDGRVRLKLRPGQTLRHYRWARHEEGWSSSLECWEWDGVELQSSVDTDGRDCDGRLSTHHEFRAVHPIGEFPNWEEVRGSQRDYTAESMNY